MTMSMSEYENAPYRNVVSTTALLLGKRLGLFRAIEEEGGLSLEELASETRLPRWLVRRWLNHQVASGNVWHDDLTEDYFLLRELETIYRD